MKNKLAVVTGVGVAMGLVSACGGGGDGSGGMHGAMPAAMSLDTAQVLALAKVTSETSLPIEVDGGMVVLTDTSETSEPVEINAM
jgi:hypothetical protein